MAKTDRHIDLRLRVVRQANPVLYARLSQFTGEGADRVRNSYIRRLCEMGMLVEEEREQRLIRAHETQSRGMAAVRDAVESATGGALSSAGAGAHDQHPAQETVRPVTTSMGPSSSNNHSPDDRPPPRVAGGGRRLLTGESGV
ncbi:MAG: hypothetical protein EPN79_11230 [Burkholderiaceae bacterium]|nr:MAG: hypothetical protein EPN79_11230 [Burkholderiaceae bacterium]TBR76745.1 MAG: hypothetical protein EPN64_05845 [Burkholderiaceae bacterium]